MAAAKNDEKLAFEVKKFPCLYDKSLSSYKENQPPKKCLKRNRSSIEETRKRRPK